MKEIHIGSLEEFSDGEPRILVVESLNLELGLFRVGNKVIAYENRCPHAGGPVCQGKLYKRVEEQLTAEKKTLCLKFGSQTQIVCPWHGYEFDLETGAHPGDPRVRLRRIPTEVRDGSVFVLG